MKSNPAACVESVLWRNATIESAIYITYAADIKLNTIMWKSPIYHIFNNIKGSSSYIEITLEEKPVYTCDDAILTSFPQIFSPLIRQEFGMENEQERIMSMRIVRIRMMRKRKEAILYSHSITTGYT
jgi:hypothetical protein